MRAGDICQLAAELVLEHGPQAREYARRATIHFRSEGALDRAQLWYAISVLLDDFAAHRLDPESPITVH